MFVLRVGIEAAAGIDHLGVGQGRERLGQEGPEAAFVVRRDHPGGVGVEVEAHAVVGDLDDAVAVEGKAVIAGAGHVGGEGGEACRGEGRRVPWPEVKDGMAGGAEGGFQAEEFARPGAGGHHHEVAPEDGPVVAPHAGDPVTGFDEGFDAASFVHRHAGPAGLFDERRHHTPALGIAAQAPGVEAFGRVPASAEHPEALVFEAARRHRIAAHHHHARLMIERLPPVPDPGLVPGEPPVPGLLHERHVVFVRPVFHADDFADVGARRQGMGQRAGVEEAHAKPAFPEFQRRRNAEDARACHDAVCHRFTVSTRLRPAPRPEASARRGGRPCV